MNANFPANFTVFCQVWLDLTFYKQFKHTDVFDIIFKTGKQFEIDHFVQNNYPGATKCDFPNIYRVHSLNLKLHNVAATFEHSSRHFQRPHR